MDVFVQFADVSKKVVIAQFGCAQDPDVYPNQGVIADDDPRYAAFLGKQVKSPI